MKNWRLHQLLKARGMDTTMLALLIESSRAHVSQVLNNKPGRGNRTRAKLARHLTAEELALAGWDAFGNIVPRGTLLQTISVHTSPGEVDENNSQGREAGHDPHKPLMRRGSAETVLPENINTPGDNHLPAASRAVSEGTNSGQNISPDRTASAEGSREGGWKSLSGEFPREGDLTADNAESADGRREAGN